MKHGFFQNKAVSKALINILASINCGIAYVWLNFLLRTDRQAG